MVALGVMWCVGGVMWWLSGVMWWLSGVLWWVSGVWVVVWFYADEMQNTRRKLSQADVLFTFVLSLFSERV